MNMRIYDGMRYYKKTDTQNNMPRTTIQLKDHVDEEILQYAAEMTFKRYRLFRMRVVADENRLYLQEGDGVPVVQLYDGKQPVVHSDVNNGHLMWIGYRDCEIYVDFFHGISDGKGISQFIGTLLYYYCGRKYGEIHLDDVSGIITMDTPENPDECKESILFLDELTKKEGETELKKSGSENLKKADVEKVKTIQPLVYEKAFVFPEEHMDSEIESQHYELRINAEAFDQYLKEKETSPASVFSLFVNHVISEKDKQNRKNKQKQEDIEEKEEFSPVVGAMAANTRRFFGAENTLQCCVATLPIWYEDKMDEMSLKEQFAYTKQMIRQGIQKENIIAGAMRTKKFNEMLEEKFPTLKEKQEFCRKLAEKGQDRYTYGISFVGTISYGKEIDDHIEKVTCMICANTSPVIIEITKFKNTYFFTYTTHLKDDPYVQVIQELFVSEGIPCTCEKMENFVESKLIY